MQCYGCEANFSFLSSKVGMKDTLFTVSACWRDAA